MNVLLTIISIGLILLCLLNVLFAVAIGVMYYNIKQMRKEIDSIFDTSANCEEFLAAVTSSQACVFSQN